MGQTVAASFQTPTLFLIATDLTKMEVDANVSESDIGGIKPGDKATFTVDAYQKRTFDGKVTQVRQSPQTVQNVVTYDVVIGVDNTDLALMPGLTAASRIVVDQRNDVTRVPNLALRYVPSNFPRTAPSDLSLIHIYKVSRTILKAAFVAIAFVVTGKFVVSAFAMLLLVFMTDFAKISLATDNVRPSKNPETWNIGGFIVVSVVLGIAMVVETLFLLWICLLYTSI